MIRRPPRSTQSRSSAASDVYKRQAVFPFTVEAAPLARRDAGGDLRRDLALASDASRAAARLARFADPLAGAPAVRARTRDREEALLKAELPGPFAPILSL